MPRGQWSNAGKGGGKHGKDPRPDPLSDDEIEKILNKTFKGDALKYVPKGKLRQIQAKIAKAKKDKK